jgi:hypothetical protein
MARYRRNRIAGATYFFTVTLRDRRSDLLVRKMEARVRRVNGALGVRLGSWRVETRPPDF